MAVAIMLAWRLDAVELLSRANEALQMESAQKANQRLAPPAQLYFGEAEGREFSPMQRRIGRAQ